ncbi:MAG: glycosyl transferase family protein [Bryobacteraceae bacterium]
MADLAQNLLTPADNLVALVLLPLALWILLSGLDDLVLDCAWIYGWFRRRLQGARDRDLREAGQTPEKLMAIFVPLWSEYRVIARMVEHNAKEIRYSRYHFFIGAYPNDEPTVEVVRTLEQRFPHVHLALCPHDGPTSKADCLNWIYQRMLQYEQQHAARFEVVVTHDAEDVIHPDSLFWINYYAERYGMVQVPVLPLPTPWWKLTHGVYCDEFSEFQFKDMPARALMRSFIPSNGVGTAFVRTVLERLAAAESNRIFEPSCLTEDYENGIRLHQMGTSQHFMPLQFHQGDVVATREFFPQTFLGAVRLRTRWVTGIALQTWQRHGWQGTLAVKYWLWRDRKGLAGNPISLVSNLVFLYGTGTWILSMATGAEWGLGAVVLQPEVKLLLAMTLSSGILRLGVRTICARRIFGLTFALAVPLRVFQANLINSLASVWAIYRYFRARWLRQPLVWLKTEHAYPSQIALRQQRLRLGEVLVGSQYISEEQLQHALATVPDGTRLGEHMVALGFVSEEEVCEALSLQHGLPSGELCANEIHRNVARTLPEWIMRQWRVLPYRIEFGSMFVASPEVPSDAMQAELRRFTHLEFRFQLITQRNFRALAEELL